MNDEKRGLRGWIPIARADSIADKSVMSLRVNGNELVAWRGESGDPHVLDAYCQHVGAHLGYGGTVRGEDIRCFYHGWTWSPEGSNTDIPYDNRIHRGRRIRSWHSVESGGQILMWHPGATTAVDDQEGAPDREAPSLPSVTGSSRTWEIDADPAVVIESFVDAATASLLPTGQITGSDVVARSESPADFGVVHRLADGSGAIRVDVLDVCTVSVEAPDWSLLVALCPRDEFQLVVTSTVSVGSANDAAGSVARVEDSLGRQLAIAARTRWRRLTADVGDPVLGSSREWAAGLQHARLGTGADIGAGAADQPELRPAAP